MRNTFGVMAVVLVLSGAGIPAKAQGDANLLTFIRVLEAGGQYDRYHADIPVSPPRPLTSMTVGEVIAWQRSLSRVKSTAAGGYQIIRKTLEDIVARHGIDLSAQYDRAMQDRMARLLISQCAEEKRRGQLAFANCLAGIWAALPLVSGPKRGKSAYQGIAGNKARTTPEKFLAVLAGANIADVEQIAPSGETIAYGEGAVKVSRRALVRSQVERMANGAAGQSVVYTFDPYAQN